MTAKGQSPLGFDFGLSNIGHSHRFLSLINWRSLILNVKKDNLIFVELIFTVAAVYLFRDSYFVHTSTGSGVRGCVRALSGCWKLEVELHTKINFVPSSNAPQDYNTLHTTHHPSMAQNISIQIQKLPCSICFNVCVNVFCCWSFFLKLHHGWQHFKKFQFTKAKTHLHL